MAVGASAKTYDALAAPVRRRLLFAGEHTCKEHPDTVRALPFAYHAWDSMFHACHRLQLSMSFQGKEVSVRASDLEHSCIFGSVLLECQQCKSASAPSTKWQL